MDTSAKNDPWRKAPGEWGSKARKRREEKRRTTNARLKDQYEQEKELFKDDVEEEGYE